MVGLTAVSKILEPIKKYSKQITKIKQFLQLLQGQRATGQQSDIFSDIFKHPLTKEQRHLRRAKVAVQVLQ